MPPCRRSRWHALRVVVACIVLALCPLPSGGSSLASDAIAVACVAGPAPTASVTIADRRRAPRRVGLVVPRLARPARDARTCGAPPAEKLVLVTRRYLLNCALLD